MGTDSSTTTTAKPAVDPKLPLLQNADLENKVVLIRVDHNVVKEGRIQDPFRIDQTIGTIFNVVARGGRPILMTHVGRPQDEESNRINMDASTSVAPIVSYLEHKLHVKMHIPRFSEDEKGGIAGIDTSINLAIKDLREKRIDAIYLPNTRWFQGEEADSDERDAFSRQLAGLAEIFVNDAFGSWQPHASTFNITRYLPSFAGFLMQREIQNLAKVLQPERPFLSVVAGAKYNTKIGPLGEIYKKVDMLILGGVIYNTYLCAKYGVSIEGVSKQDIDAAAPLVAMDARDKKILELPYVYESDTMEGKLDGHFRVRSIQELKKGMKLGYILDIARESFDDPHVSDKINSAYTIFVNAVMGYTPYFTEGSTVMDQKIDRNKKACKLYGGGDTLQEFKDLNPGLYLSVMDDSQYYFFTGGGTVLKAIEQGTPYGLEPVRALIENGGRHPS